MKFLGSLNDSNKIYDLSLKCQDVKYASLSLCINYFGQKYMLLMSTLVVSWQLASKLVIPQIGQEPAGAGEEGQGQREEMRPGKTQAMGTKDKTLSFTRK